MVGMEKGNMSDLDIKPSGNKSYHVLDYPTDAYQNSPLPVPPTATFGIVKNENVFLSPNGGVIFYPENNKFPVKGFRRGDKMFGAEAIKKYLKGWLSVLSTSPHRYFEKWIDNFGSYCLSQTGHFWLTENWYSPPVQEIQRVLLSLSEKESFKRITKTIAFILELDRPYLWRLQDILQLLNKTNAEKRPTNEARRLLKIFSERDHARNWKQIGTLVWIIMILSPKARKFFRAFAKELDTSKMWFDEADLYHNLRNSDPAGVGYDYMGLPREKRFELWEKVANGTA